MCMSVPMLLFGQMNYSIKRLEMVALLLWLSGYGVLELCRSLPTCIS